MHTVETHPTDLSKHVITQSGKKAYISTKQLLKDTECAFNRLAQNVVNQPAFHQGTLDDDESVSQQNDPLVTTDESSEKCLSDCDGPSPYPKKTHLRFKSFLKKWSKKEKRLKETKQHHYTLSGKIVDLLFSMDLWRIKSQHMFFHSRQQEDLVEYQNNKILIFGNSEKNTTYLRTSHYSLSRVKLDGELFTTFFFFKLPDFERLPPSHQKEFCPGENLTRIGNKQKQRSPSPGPLSLSPQTAEEYLTYIKKFTTQYFYKKLSLFKQHVVPDIKQDSKDLSRDTLRINGQLISGTNGYQTLYQIVTRLLLSEEYELEYLNFLAKEALYDDCDPLHSSRHCEGSDEPGDSLLDMFCRTELQAIILLHVINRTLAGGHCFDAVLSSFQNDLHGLIVSDSQAAQPLEFIIGQDHDVLAAILYSHIAFKIHNIPSETPNTKECSPCLANIHAYFISDVNLNQTLSPNVLDILCWLMRYNSQKVEGITYDLYPFSSPYVAFHLESWINERSQHIQKQYAPDCSIAQTYEKFMSISDASLPYRIYITQNSYTSIDSQE